MDNQVNDPPDRARDKARRSTLAGVGGLLLIGIAVALTLLDVAGLLLPTVLGIFGVGAVIAAVATGALQVSDAYQRPDGNFDH